MDITLKRYVDHSQEVPSNSMCPMYCMYLCMHVPMYDCIRVCMSNYLSVCLSICLYVTCVCLHVVQFVICIKICYLMFVYWTRSVLPLLLFTSRCLRSADNPSYSSGYMAHPVIYGPHGRQWSFRVCIRLWVRVMSLHPPLLALPA